MKNDAQDFAQRLYSRVPAHYRAYDAEQGFPLQALLQVVGEQAATLRQNLDDLWDDYFIETCHDWAVPYIGALIGANLLANPITRSNRLEVRDAISFRRSKGTPAMLQALAAEVSGWPADFTEFFRALGWCQNLNHIRMDRVLTPDVRDAYRLSLLGRAADPFAHAADFRPSVDLDQPRIVRGGSGMGNPAWGTPGRQQIKNLGFFVRRLQTFGVAGANPVPLAPSLFAFDPLGRDVPLFSEASGDAITRDAFQHAASQFFGAGRDLAVRLNGIPLAAGAEPAFSSSRQPFTFGGLGAVALNPTSGMRLLTPREFQGRGAGFRVNALWGTGGTVLGTLQTTLASRGAAGAFQLHAAGAGAKQLVITIEAVAGGARFPGAVIAVRAARNGALRITDAVYVYLPAVFVPAGSPATFLVADDGSTYFSSGFDPTSLARASEGQTFPPSNGTASPASVAEPLISRTAGALAIADPARIPGAAMVIQAELFTGIFQPQGAVATVNQPAAQFPQLMIPGPVWPANTFVPSLDAFSGNLPDSGTLAMLLLPINATFFPACEVVVRFRGGESLLVYLPEIQNVPAGGRRVFVAEDGSTRFAPNDIQTQPGLLDGFPLARAAAGQVLPISGAWPMQFRKPVALDLCAPERTALLAPGELGIDPERGRFAFPAGDPAASAAVLTVDFREAFTDRVGALTYDRLLDPSRPASRFVCQNGDSSLTLADNLASAPVHRTLPAALAAAQDGDIIEIADSSTYTHSSDLLLANAVVKSLTIRAAEGHRPCLRFQNNAAIRANRPMTALELNGLLISGGPLLIQSKISSLLLAACTLDPRGGVSLLASDVDLNSLAKYVLCRCVTGSLQTGPGVAQLTVADSIVGATTAASSVQLERVTVLGGIHTGVLSASESILDAIAIAEDQQSGCIRFSRFEAGSILPRRYHCVPSETQAAGCTEVGRCFGPIFNSRRFGSPLYGQLATNCPPEILSASEQASEIGAFTGALNPIRLQNLRTKLQEFMPVGLTPVIVAES